MTNITERLDAIDWQSIRQSMAEKGYTHASNFLTTKECSALIKGYDDSTLYRKTITMERYRFGLGEYKYFNYPLPALIQTIREGIYPKLAPIANGWMEMLGIDKRFPDTLTEVHALCLRHNQVKPTVLILK